MKKLFLFNLLSLTFLFYNLNTYTVLKTKEKKLILAAQNGNLKDVKFLLEKGANINKRIKGETPLQIAAYLGHLEIVKLLVKNGADISKKIIGRTPLHLAICNGHIEIVKYLVENGAIIDDFVKNNEHDSGYMPLHLAAKAKKNKVRIFKFLVNKGAKINKEDYTGWRPLHWSASKGLFNTTKLLLQNGADPNQKNRHNESPLHHAAYNNHIKVVKLLIKNKAIPNEESNNGNTPLSLSIDESETKNFLENIGEDNIIKPKTTVTKKINEKKTFIDILKNYAYRKPNWVYPILIINPEEEDWSLVGILKRFGKCLKSIYLRHKKYLTHKRLQNSKEETIRLTAISINSNK